MCIYIRRRAIEKECGEAERGGEETAEGENNIFCGTRNVQKYKKKVCRAVVVAGKREN